MYPGVHAVKTPDKTAYRMAESGRKVTYRELEERSNRGAHLLRSLGLRRGDHIALCMENNEHYFPVCWAAQRAGIYYTAISSRLTPPEVEYIVNDCGAKVLVASLAKRDLAEALAGRCPGLVGRLKHPLPEGPIGSPPALVAGIMAMYGGNADSVYLSPAPLYHSAPLGFTMAMLRLGATVVVMEHFDAERALALIQEHRVTHSQWVPTMFVRMLKLPEAVRGRYDVSSLRYAIHAAAPCPVQVKEQMIAWWGPILYEYYAGTEGNGFCAIDSTQWLAHKGSVGRPLNAKVHILDDEHREQPPGEVGTIFFESAVKYEYHNDAAKTEGAKSPQGWTTLGDVGYVDEEGWLYLTDRKAFMIISGGVNIYPQETEDCLIGHPKVADVAVIGVPNEEFGEEVKAVVQPASMADAGPALEKELIEYCKERISPVKCPRSVDFMAELPRHPTGKLYKRLLKDRYWGNRESRIV
jgi:acyl-CoA synthetase (AMP-forming)/AMP-acid ligase II